MTHRGHFPMVSLQARHSRRSELGAAWARFGEALGGSTCPEGRALRRGGGGPTGAQGGRRTTPDRPPWCRSASLPRSKGEVPPATGDWLRRLGHTLAGVTGAEAFHRRLLPLDHRARERGVWRLGRASVGASGHRALQSAAARALLLALDARKTPARPGRVTPGPVYYRR